MRQQHALIPTLRTVGEAEMISHQLLLRAGFIRQLAAGIYNYLPLGKRVLNKVEQIVREEMDEIGGQELLMPALNPAELWEESGRYETYGPDLVRLQDRHERSFILGPTHEETVTDIVRNEINSYKKLPATLYQIQTKFRDERRPRSGLLRGREFLMKDAYSFHADRDSLDATYEDMYRAYTNIFTRLGMDFRAVEADSGAIGGKGTHEFMALSSAGEDYVAICESCDYSANIEMAEVVGKFQVSSVEGVAFEKVATPGKGSIQEVADFLEINPSQLVKSLLFMVDEKPVLVLVRGDHEVNDVKIKNFLDATMVGLADGATVRRVTGTTPGYVGPVSLQEKVMILADQAIQGLSDMVVGANEKDTHLLHVQAGRDFDVDHYVDLRNIQEGDACPRCGGVIKLVKGIEIGHIFKLGTKYSDAMKAKFLDQNGKEKSVIMGCYGIGISRAMASVVEQHHDENGIVWPVSIAPFHVHLIAVNMKDEAQREAAEKLYQELRSMKIEVLFDDRFERAGVKFKDADLLGIPVRVVVGSKAECGVVEMKARRTGHSEEVSLSEIRNLVPEWLEKADQK
ncbi:proline--tRNA ligase [Baia soyae]|uniref:Proline--tRNA ligase n=1 Tax=Baia soyae TaxID=1544746 RepID=A0A4R2SFN2_9BACL|nr:proline--tRNA ligase [Baia soyae]TCP70110.1 prolyl-tRNA synthetase [Baia soyae]